MTLKTEIIIFHQVLIQMKILFILPCLIMILMKMENEKRILIKYIGPGKKIGKIQNQS